MKILVTSRQTYLMFTGEIWIMPSRGSWYKEEKLNQTRTRSLYKVAFQQVAKNESWGVWLALNHKKTNLDPIVQSVISLTSS